jgi:hypothetical protein
MIIWTLPFIAHSERSRHASVVVMKSLHYNPVTHMILHHDMHRHIAKNKCSHMQPCYTKITARTSHGTHSKNNHGDTHNNTVVQPIFLVSGVRLCTTPAVFRKKVMSKETSYHYHHTIRNWFSFCNSQVHTGKSLLALGCQKNIEALPPFTYHCYIS